MVFSSNKRGIKKRNIIRETNQICRLSAKPKHHKKRKLLCLLSDSYEKPNIDSGKVNQQISAQEITLQTRLRLREQLILLDK